MKKENKTDRKESRLILHNLRKKCLSIKTKSKKDLPNLKLKNTNFQEEKIFA